MLHRPSATIAMAAVLALTAACAGSPPSPTHESADELAEFQQEISVDIDKVDIFLQKTQRGVNLSDFTLGWFTMILLNELCTQDQELFDHLHVDGMNVELYLRNAFQANPQREIAFIDAMARKTNSPIRLAARHALEMLTRIPNAADSSEIQAQARKDLAATLAKLETVLTQVADSAAPRP